MVLKVIDIADLNADMFAEFHHMQQIKQKYVNIEDKWTVTAADEIRQWDFDKRKWIPEYLRRQLMRGGFAICAYEDEKIAGFGCVDGVMRGRAAKYLNLTMLFVDDRYQRRQIGKNLFVHACEIAAQKGADKLFISAIPSVETVEFYLHMGCADADEIIDEFVDTEDDRYLEYVL